MNPCTAGCGRPVHDAHVCTYCADGLARALGDVTALVDRPRIRPDRQPGEADDHTWRNPRTDHGSLPSTIFDTPSGAALLGKSRNLGGELDTTRAHQAMITRRDTGRGKPGSRVFEPRKHLDRVQHQLDAALTAWANVVQADNPDATAPGAPHRPRNDHTGAALGNLAGWLLHHVEWIRKQPDAADAITQICGAVDAVERAIDTPPEQVYVGPCWAKDTTAPGGECRTDLYARTGDNVVVCTRCLHQHPVEERRQWLRDHMHDALATATEVSRAAAILGLPVTPERVWQWKSRGKISPHGHRFVGRREVPLYRIGDIFDLASADIEERDSKRRRAEKKPA